MKHQYSANNLYGPKDVCSGCGAHGVKLWRSRTSLQDIKLLCATCIKPSLTLTPDGASSYEMRWTGADGVDYRESYMTYTPEDGTEGELIPAVFHKKGMFYNMGHIPDEMWEAWRQLPNYLEDNK